MFYMRKFCKYFAEIKKPLFGVNFFCVVDLFETEMNISTFCSLCPRLYTCLFLITFVSLFQYSMHVMFWKITFKVFKHEKTALKNLKDKKHRQSENGELKVFERVVILLLNSSKDGLHYCLTTFCQKTFLIASMMRNNQ